uniref:RRM domain-containing protein n=1 Tax=Moniliophthora roreri TaxID=221103 RepID=A0A0W0G770_MONRR
MIDKRGGSGGKVAKGGKRTTVLRKEEGRRKSLGGPDVAGMESLLFVGDLSNGVSDDVLSNAFNKYPSFQKARAKYGFVTFSDPEDFLRPWKEMDDKYVGNRPVKLKKADQTAIRPIEIGHRKAKQLERELKRNRRKPY